MKTDNRKTRNPVIVAEAGAHHLKLVQVQRGRGGGKTTAAYLKCFDKADEETIQEMAAAIKKLKLSHTPVIGCLPRQSVNVRLLEVPSTDPDEIANMVELQVGKQTPYSKDEIVSDYRIISGTRKGYTRIMLIVVQKGLMRQRFRLLEDVGLRVENMSVSSEGILNWYRSSRGAGEPGKAVVLLDVDSEYTDFGVIIDGQLVFTRSILVGSTELAEDRDGARSTFRKEVQHSLEIYRSETRGKTGASRILLTGAGAKIEGIEKLLADDFAFPVEKVESNPARATDLPDSAKVSFTAVTGMASAPESLEFALVPEAVATRRDLTSTARTVTSTGVLIMGTVSLMSVLALVSLNKEISKLARQEAAFADKKEAAESVMEKKELTTMIVRQLDSRHAPVSILLELHEITPKGVVYDTISITVGDRIRLRGKAQQYTDVDALMKQLEASEVFPAGEITNPARKETADKTQFEFEILLVMGS